MIYLQCVQVDETLKIDEHFVLNAKKNTWTFLRNMRFFVSVLGERAIRSHQPIDHHKTSTWNSHEMCSSWNCFLLQLLYGTEVKHIRKLSPCHYWRAPHELFLTNGGLYWAYLWRKRTYSYIGHWGNTFFHIFVISNEIIIREICENCLEFYK